MNRTHFLDFPKRIFAKKRLKFWVISGGIFLLVISYFLIFFIPKPVQFSYAGKTCLRHLLLAPGLQSTTSDNGFKLVPQNEVKLGGVSLFSTKLCFEPTKAPQEGSLGVAVAPWGSFFAAKQFAIKVPQPPKVQNDDVVGRAISTTRPLEVRLTSDDVLHSYYLEIANKTTPCAQTNARLLCDVTTLDLEQGTDYSVGLYRRFAESAQEKLLEGTLTTLVPLVQTSASLNDGQVIYDMPELFTYSFDQPLAEVDATLEKITEAAAAEKIETNNIIDGQNLTVSTIAPLAREASYRLTIRQAVSEKGNSLAEPIVKNFTTSGGPKVTAVSVGASGVAPNAQIVITFDQPINESVDITRFVRTNGATSAARKLSATQVALTLQNAPNCAAFTVVADKGIKSGSNNESSKDGWSFGSRVICGTSWVIGYSVRGRPIVAYSFGTGPTNLLFTAGIHGSEPSSTSTMQSWVSSLQAGSAASIPADKRVVIVPNTNPDAIAAGSRNSANNVNIARNFPTANWKADIETYSGLLQNGGGASAGSEPETRALMDLTRQLRPRLQVSFHAQGRLVGANKYDDSVTIGNIYAQTVGYQTMFYNAEAVMGYEMTGEFEEWMGEEMGLPAILIELPSLSGNYLSSQLPALNKMLTL